MTTPAALDLGGIDDLSPPPPEFARRFSRLARRYLQLAWSLQQARDVADLIPSEPWPAPWSLERDAAEAVIEARAEVLYGIEDRLAAMIRSLTNDRPLILASHGASGKIEGWRAIEVAGLVFTLDQGGTFVRVRPAALFVRFN